MLSVRSRRSFAVAGAAALSIAALAGSTGTAHADPQTIPGNNMTVTVEGGPLTMEGIGTPCGKGDPVTGENPATPSRLVGPPITVTIQLDAGIVGGTFTVEIGEHAGYTATVDIPQGGSGSVVVPNDGPGTDYTCADETYGGSLEISASAPGSNGSIGSNYYLSSVD